MTQQTRMSWKIKDEAVLQELLLLMQISDQERALLAALHPAAVDASAAMAKDFYKRLLAHEETHEYFKNSSLNGLHMTTGQWFEDLFSGTYDEEYAHKRLKIGKVHVKIGLPVRYPIAMLDVIMNHGEVVARKSSDPDTAVAAFRKLVGLDLAIFNQAYEDNQLLHLAELVGGERLARLLLTGQD